VENGTVHIQDILSQVGMVTADTPPGTVGAPAGETEPRSSDVT
jgi:hypothetical protein